MTKLLKMQVYKCDNLGEVMKKLQEAEASRNKQLLEDGKSSKTNQHPG